MKNQLMFLTFVLCVISAFSAIGQQDTEDDVIQGYQYASAASGALSSPTIAFNQPVGYFEKNNDGAFVFQVPPGEILDCRFALPETAFDVKAIIKYNVQNKDVKYRINWNDCFLLEEQAVSSTDENPGLVQKEIQLKDFRRHNDLEIIPFGSSFQFFSVKILYKYRMPESTLGEVKVKLLKPDTDIGILTPDLTLIWEGVGPCEKGWVALKYKDGEEWKSIPGAEALNMQDKEWKNKSCGQFVWKNHGLKTFPDLKVEYNEGINPKQEKQKQYAEGAKKLFEEAKKLFEERKFPELVLKIDEIQKNYPLSNECKSIEQNITDQLVKDAQKLFEEQKYLDSIDNINTALQIFPDNNNYNSIRQKIADQIVELSKKLFKEQKDEEGRTSTAFALYMFAYSNRGNCSEVLQRKADQFIVKAREELRRISEPLPPGERTFAEQQQMCRDRNQNINRDILISLLYAVRILDIAASGFDKNIMEKEADQLIDEAQKFYLKDERDPAYFTYDCAKALLYIASNYNGEIDAIYFKFVSVQALLYNDVNYSYGLEIKNKANQCADKARKLYEQHKGSEAIVLIHMAVDLDPENEEYKQIKEKIANQIYEDAKKEYNEKNYDKALCLIDRSRRMYPLNHEFEHLGYSINLAKDPFIEYQIDLRNDVLHIHSRIAGARAVKVINGVEFAFRWCPPGTFMMGSPTSEEGRYDDEKQHRVTLTKGFWMMETEVTQKQWKAVMGNNLSYFKGDNLPVEEVSWNDCQEFCKKCTQLGFPVQLPTEAQWEYACRAGTTGAYAGNLDDMVWYWDNSDRKTHPVGTKKPNAWGLYDMHGNVWEWCQDWYAKEYPSGSVTNPMGPSSGSSRVIRGGGFIIEARYCRSACRRYVGIVPRSWSLGFRCVKGQ